MTRYQIKMLDSDLTALVHEIAVQTASGAAEAVKDQPQAPTLPALYPLVFDACKDVLKPCVRGFHVCGCLAHCDAGVERTELASPYAPAPGLQTLDYRDPRIHRYVLDLEVPLMRFVREMEARILQAIVSHSTVRNWHRLLFPVIRTAVESTLGKYVYQAPCCNRGEYICEVGVCTQFDPWERIQPGTWTEGRP